MTGQVGPRWAALAVLMLLTPARQEDRHQDESALKRWAYPDATPGEVTHSAAAGGAARLDGALYSTADPFHEVVRFYVERSGFEPPNWNILGRKFPGDTLNVPGSWSKWGKAQVPSLHHNIRPDSATAGLLVTDFSGCETVSVSI